MLFKAGLTALLVCAGAGSAFAQTNEVETTGSTTIARAVTIEKDFDLAFGRIIRPTTGSSTVTMPDNSNTVGVTGTAVTAGGTTTRAQYTVVGEGAQLVAVTIPANFSMTEPGTDTLLVTLDSSLAGTTVTLDGTAGAEGDATFGIGGSFSIDDTTTLGAYTGTFDVSVAYQ